MIRGRRRPPRPFSASLCALVLAAGCPGGTVTASKPLSLDLRVLLAKPSFYDGEPIHVTFELRNSGSDTAFLRPFGLGAHWLTAQLLRADGSEVPVSREFWVDYVLGTGYRGDALLPGESLFETTVVQTRWGGPSPFTESLYLFHLPSGRYVLRATFHPDVNIPKGHPPRTVAAEPVRFTVVARTPHEDSLYAGYERVAAPLDVRTWLPEQFGVVVDWCEARLTVDTLDATVNDLLVAAVSKASIRGYGPDSAGLAKVQLLRVRVARMQADRPSGAAAVDAYYSLTQWLRRGDPSITVLLGETLGGRVAAAWDRRLAHGITR